MAGLAAAKRRGLYGGRPPTIDAEKLDQITVVLAGGASKSSISRTFNVPDRPLRTPWLEQGGQRERRTCDVACPCPSF